MTNINITTSPTGRSPENKYFFGEKTTLRSGGDFRSFIIANFIAILNQF